MAGRGPTPKNDGERRRLNEPARGEWEDIPTRNPKRPPKMPTAPREGWAPGTKLAWKSWWTDGASSMWGPADLEAVRALAHLHTELERGKSSLAGEVRLRMDSLGLTPRGKRDNRWRVVEHEGAAQGGTPPKQKPSRYRHLRAVDAG